MTTVPQRAALLQERLEQLDCVFDKSFDESKHPRVPSGRSEGGQFASALERQVARSLASSTTRQTMRAVEGVGLGHAAAHTAAHIASHTAGHAAGHLTREALTPDKEERGRRLKKFHDMLLGRA